MLIHVQRRRVGGVGGGGTVSAGSTMYIGNRVSADICAVMVGGDGQRGGGMCAAHSRDSISVMYRISDNDSIPSDSHCWLATMDVAVLGMGSRRGAGTLTGVEPAMREPALQAPVESVPLAMVPRAEPRMTPPNTVTEEGRASFARQCPLK